MGVVFALGIEAGGLEDLMADVVTIRSPGIVVRRGRLASRRVAIVQSRARLRGGGSGDGGPDRGPPARLGLLSRVRRGLDETLKKQDVLMVDRVVYQDGQSLSLDLKVDPSALAATPGVHAGSLLTTDRIIRLASERRELGKQHGALAVDMETFAVAEVCRRDKVP